MRRISTLVLALAVLSLPLAGTANVLKENARTHATVTVVSHRVHRPTADEVGRAAGLKIRQELALKRAHESAWQREHAGVARRVETAKRRGRATGYASESRASETGLRESRASESRLVETMARQETAPGAESLTVEQRRRLEAEQRAAAAWRESAAERNRPAAEPVHRVEAVQTASPSEDETAAIEQPMPRLVRTRLLLMAPPLKGSLASLERQNERLEAEGLDRIEDEADLSGRIAEGSLIPVPVSDALTVNPDLPEHHRYCRPWTAVFLKDLAQMHAEVFHSPLEVSSAVRTVVYQQHLRAINGNAAPAEGDVVSPHLTGATIDIAKDGLSRQEIGWMRRWLLPLEIAGKIDVEEEFQQACFHITVYKTYAPSRPATHVRLPRAVAVHQAAPVTPAAPAEPTTPAARPVDVSDQTPTAG